MSTLYCDITNINSATDPTTGEASDNPETADNCNITITFRYTSHSGPIIQQGGQNQVTDQRDFQIGHLLVGSPAAAYTEINFRFATSLFSTSGTSIYPTGGSSPDILIYNGSSAISPIITENSETGHDVLNYAKANTLGGLDSGSTITDLDSLKIKIRVNPASGFNFINTVATFEALCFPPFTLIDTSVGLREIKDLVRKDEIVTKNGNVDLTQCHRTATIGKIDYVHLPKDCLTEGVPSYDVYVTPPHPFSLDYKSLPDEDIEYRLEPRQLVGRIPGVEKVQLEVDSYYNPVFDSSQIINVGNLKFFSHHPNTHPYILPKNLYLTKPYDKKITLTYLTLDKLLEEKDKDQDIGEYIASLIRFN
jgi:hypothetical protein